MLLEHVEHVCAQGADPCSAEDRTRINRIVSRYIVRLINSGEFRREAKGLPDDLRRAVVRLKVGWLDASVVPQMLWRAVYQKVLSPQISFKLLHSRWEATQADIKLVVTSLTPSEVVATRKLARAIPTTTISDSDLNTIMGNLVEFAWRLIYIGVKMYGTSKTIKGLTFVLDNDPSLEPGDLVNDLLTSALNAIRRRDYIDNTLYLHNLAKRTMINEAANMAKLAAMQCRARVRKSEDGKGFHNRVLSLNVPLNADNPTTTMLEGLVADDIPQDEQTDMHSMIATLMIRLPKRMRRVVEITMGADDVEFDRWLVTVHGMDSSKINDDVRLAWYARQFMGVNKQELRHKASPILRPDKAVPASPVF